MRRLVVAGRVESGVLKTSIPGVGAPGYNEGGSIRTSPRFRWHVPSFDIGNTAPHCALYSVTLSLPLMISALA